MTKSFWKDENVLRFFLFVFLFEFGLPGLFYLLAISWGDVYEAAVPNYGTVPTLNLKN